MAARLWRLASKWTGGHSHGQECTARLHQNNSVSELREKMQRRNAVVCSPQVATAAPYLPMGSPCYSRHYGP